MNAAGMTHLPQAKEPGALDHWLPPLLIWLGSLYAMPQMVFIVAMAVTLLIRKRTDFLRSLDFKVLVIITMLSLLNFIYGVIDLPQTSSERKPYFMAYLFCYVLATQMRKRDLQIIAYLIAMESGFIFVEALMGVNTVFTSHPQFRSGLSFQMLYFARPFGLSDGVNDMGGKIMIGIVLTDYLIERGLARNIARVVLGAALILTFSRTAILAALVHYVIYFIFHFKSKKKWPVLIAVAGLVLAAVVLTDVFSLAEVATQLNRGKEDGVDFSYRDVIWETCLKFIAANPFFGNGSSRFYIFLGDYGAWEHAHNSFLHLFTANGIIIASLTSIWLACRFTRDNIKFVVPLLVFSSGQYGIFWGVSFMDVLFLYLVLQRSEVLSAAVPKLAWSPLAEPPPPELSHAK